MLAQGNPNSPLLIVMTAKPSEGMENWFWRIVQDKYGILQKDVRLVYILDELPKGNAGRPKKEQLRASWERFYKEIIDSNPKVVMPMGSTALYYLTGIRESIFDARGYVLTRKYFRDIEWETWEQVGVYKTGNKTRGVTKGDPKFKWITHSSAGLLGASFDGIVIPTFDLDSHIRKSAFTITPAFREDVSRVKRALDDNLIMIDKDFSYFVNFNTLVFDDLKAAMRTTSPLTNVKWREVIAVDIETHVIDNEVIDRVSVSDGFVSASLAWSLDKCTCLKDLFSLSKALFGFHNSPFDVPRLRGNGVQINERVLRTQIFDTMFGAVTLQPDLYKGLGKCVTVYLDCEPWKWKILSENDPIFYSAKDAFMTAWLARQEIKVMKALGTWDMFMGQNFDYGPGIMATIPELTEMTRGGLKTDRDFANGWLHKLERNQLRYEKLWSAQFPINPHSVKDLKKLLYTDWKLPVQHNREHKISTDELALIKLQMYIQNAPEEDQNPWRLDLRCKPVVFDLLLNLRDISKIISTYVQPVSEGLTRYVHPEYLPLSKDDENKSAGQIMGSKGNTATGRLATYNPNIGNQPKKVRKLYIPDSQAFCFIQADWKAAELQVLEYSANDQRLIDDLRHELHKRNAERFGVTRDVAKNVIYASQYLAGPSKVSEMILEQEHIYVPVAECKRIMDGLSEYYYASTAFKRHLIELCNTKKHIKNPFGRIRTFHDGRAPAAVDYWPQSIVADCLWCVLKDVADMARSHGGRLTTTVYDSILIQVPKSEVDDASYELRGIMQREFPNVAPKFMIPVDIEIGDPGASWADLKKEVMNINRIFNHANKRGELERFKI